MRQESEMAESEYKSKADVLYEDVVAYQENIEAIMSQDGASPSDIAEAVGFQKENLKDEIMKCYKTRQNYAFAAESLEAEYDILIEKAKTVKERMAGFKAKAATLDEVIKTAMIALGEERIFMPLVTIEIKASAPKVEIDDEDAVPDEFRSEPKKPEPSKTLLKPYLLEHPECEFAHIEKTMDVKYTV